MEVISTEKVKINKDFSNRCPECGGQIISIPQTGDVLCGQCGLIIAEKVLDYSHTGRRAFTSQEKDNRERTGSPISSLVPDIGLTTVIDRKDITNPDLKRAAKWNTRMDWEKRNLLIATTELKRIAGNLNLPEYVKEEAIKLYKIAYKKNLLRGRSILGMVAATLYFACRSKKIPRSLHEILEHTSVSDKNVRRCYRILIRELGLKAPNTDPLSFIPKYISKLNLDPEITKLSTQLVEAYKQRVQTSGKDPKGICAGAIYLACRIKRREITQKEIAEQIGVTEVTLRSRFKEFTKVLNILI